MPLISVITPASRGIKELSCLLNDFHNQTFQDFEHLIIYDGNPPPNVIQFIEENKGLYNFKFISIPKDYGDMNISPGTKPRNYGISISSGKFVVFFDDDDRAKDTYLETLITGATEENINVVQMTCSEERMIRGGKKDQIRLVPEIGLTTFPVMCHIGTPCFMVPTKWAKEDPWRAEPEHDFRFIKRIVEKHRPNILLKNGMQVDVDGLVIKNMKDWVSHPPFIRS